MLGLERYKVQIVAHRPEWISLAEEVCQEIRLSAGKLLADIRHVGSTAVPGLPAKPILDIVAAVSAQDMPLELIQRLTEIGYIYRGDKSESGGHLFVRESLPDVRTIHLHVVEHNGTKWQSYLKFRDLLRQNADIRKAYIELKQSLMKRFPDDRKSYTASKHDFIQKVLKLTQ